MTGPSFTFILPAFNAAGASFERALTSIRDQRYPEELVELLVADGGSSDTTAADAQRLGARVIGNPNRLAEWGVKEGILVAQGDIVVVFAADNELVGLDWLATVASLFAADEQLFAVYGRLVSGRDDPPLNKYVELIQSEPMNWFLNRNLETYLAAHPLDDHAYATFEIDPAHPLIWGANGLALRREWALPSWQRPGYVADVDAFHAAVQAGHSRVAYTPRPYVYHHQVATLADLRHKWRRNAKQHLVGQAGDRDLDWVLVPGFRRRALLWVVYSLVPVFSSADAVRRAVRDRSIYWLYHPAATFFQALTYVEALASTGAGRRLLSRSLRRG